VPTATELQNVARASSSTTTPENVCPAIRSARLWIGALRAWACSTRARIRARAVFAPPARRTCSTSGLRLSMRRQIVPGWALQRQGFPAGELETSRPQQAHRATHTSTRMRSAGEQAQPVHRRCNPPRGTCRGGTCAEQEQGGIGLKVRPVAGGHGRCEAGPLLKEAAQQHEPAAYRC